jgi:hypothetical protein
MTNGVTVRSSKDTSNLNSKHLQINKTKACRPACRTVQVTHPEEQLNSHLNLTPELKTIVEHWSKLPQAVKTGILAMVKASVPDKGG